MPPLASIPAIKVSHFAIQVAVRGAKHDRMASGSFRIPSALPSLVTKQVELSLRFWTVKPLASVFNGCIVEPLKDLAQIGFELQFKCDRTPAAEFSGAGEFPCAFLQMF